MKTIAVPALRSSPITRIRSSISFGVSTAVGSSRMRTPALRVRAFRISTRCWIPTGRSSTRASGSTSSPNRSESSRTLAAAALRDRRPNGPLTSSCPSMTFSATVKTGMSMKCWCTMPIPASIAAPGPENLRGVPSMTISPSSGWYRP